MTPSPLSLIRDDLRDFAGYRSARSSRLDGEVWLNANESPWASAAAGAGQSRRYPEPQPVALREALASLYGCAAGQVLAGRGSDEAIDLLVRAFCRPGGDAVVVTPPTFGMYAVCAQLHGARVVEVPLRDGAAGFECDFDAVARAVETSDAKLVFLCSPGNPAGNLLPLESIRQLAVRVQERALVVIDEAYIEFAGAASAVSLLTQQRNVAVLRTLSKAHALAAARVGCLVADAGLVELLRRCQAPYPLPRPSVELACAALAPAARQATEGHVAELLAERERVAAALADAPPVTRVVPSQANFLLVRFADATAVYERLLGAGIVVRDLRAMPGLGDALRITIGTRPQNDLLIETVLSTRAASAVSA